MLVGCGAGAVAGCGGSHSSSSVAGAGKGVGYRLRQEGLRHCAGPLAATGDPSPATGNPDPVSLAVYAEPGLGALVATGAGAEDHAVNLAVIRNNVAGNRTAADEAQVESSWLRKARKALRSSDVPTALCRSQVPKMPVLAATEVVCQDEVLIPLGRKSSMGRFTDLLSSLLDVEITPQQQTQLANGTWITTAQQVDVTRPYCHG